MGSIISYIVSLFQTRELNSNECGICRKELSFPITIDCNHTFCYACLSHWQKTSSLCPLCSSVIRSRDIWNINKFVYNSLCQMNFDQAIKEKAQYFFPDDRTIEKTAYTPFFQSFLNLSHKEMDQLISYASQHFHPKNIIFYYIYFLCSFKSFDDFVSLTKEVQSIGEKHIHHLSFLFPDLDNENNLPDIRYEYLPILRQLSCEKVKLFYGLVKLWESHKRVDITKLCNMISEMNESQYQEFCKRVLNLEFSSWKDSYHIYRLIQNSNQEQLLKILLADFYPYQQWNNTYRSRVSLFSLFVNSSEKDINEFVCNVDCIHNLDVDTVTNLENIAKHCLQY